MFSKYDVYTTVQSMYCYPDTDVLINKLDIRVRKDYKISITLNASFNQVEQLKAVSTYDGAEIFEGISEKGA